VEDGAERPQGGLDANKETGLWVNSGGGLLCPPPFANPALRPAQLRFPLPGRTWRRGNGRTTLLGKRANDEKINVPKA